MIHKSLPQTKTAEALAIWIRDQHKDTATHTEKFALTEEEIQGLEHTSAQASAALYRLKEVEDLFKSILKHGTVSLPDEKGEPVLQPYDVTIPPTKGTKALEANRKFADDQLKEGFRYEHTNIYLIPWPEESKMVAVDIEGKEWPQYTRFMTNAELNANKPLLKDSGMLYKNSKGDFVELPEGEAGKDWTKEEVKEYFEKDKIVLKEGSAGDVLKKLKKLPTQSDLTSDLFDEEENSPFI